MPSDAITEARRQIQICNACRYCEGYCSVFPAIQMQRNFAEGDIVQFANLCHDCRGCYHACQYIAPHEFDINVPRALASVRQQSWKAHAWPSCVGQLFDRSALASSSVMVVSLAILFWLTTAMRPASGEGFYSFMSHSLMVAIFVPSFLLPLIAVGISVRRYWKAVGGGSIRWKYIAKAVNSLARMDNLSGGHGEGCNFEDGDRFSNTRRWLHQATLAGFLLCFASTCSGTLLHYGFGMEAPYGFLSVPKLLGVPGGILLCTGTAGLAWLKTKADPNLGVASAWGGEMAFILVLFGTSATGLILFAATSEPAVQFLLPLHLGFVLTFFLMIPYSKMVHGFHRLAALLRNAEMMSEDSSLRSH